LSPDADTPDPQVLRAKLDQETARIPWTELQRFFARGVTVWVAADLDLVDTGLAFARDDAPLIQAEMALGRIARVADDQARDWLAGGAELWALVVSPWVLVQEPAASPKPH
jgi:hypothetical protein